jgi:DNA-directed RNA polymerase specialized sigma24 family protein
MAFASVDWDHERVVLAGMILRVIREWPERQRRVFVAAHYQNQTVDQIAASHGMGVGDVRSILRQCECRLHEALKSFRNSDLHVETESGGASSTLMLRSASR